MAKLSLSLDTLGELDNGIAGPLIDREIRRAIEDLYDRGEEDGVARKVTIQLELQIKQGIVAASVAAEAKLPPRRTKRTAAGVQHREGRPDLFFQSNNAERADQPTFPTLDDEKE